MLPIPLISGLRAGSYSVNADPQPHATLPLKEGQETSVEQPSVSNGQSISIRPG